MQLLSVPTLDATEKAQPFFYFEIVLSSRFRRCEGRVVDVSQRILPFLSFQFRCSFRPDPALPRSYIGLFDSEKEHFKSF